MGFRINLEIITPYTYAATYEHSQSHTNPGMKASGLGRLPFSFPLITT